MKTYRKHTWVGNKITAENMAELYTIKKRTRKPITELVAESVTRYISDVKGVNNVS